MQNKRVVFYLLLMVVTAGFITFVIHHYKQSQKPGQILNEYSWGKGKILVTEDKNLKELLSKYTHCSLHRGIPLEVENEEPGVVTITKLSSLPEHQNLTLKVGDKLINTGFMVKNQEAQGIIQKITDTGSVEKVNYVPAIILYCVQ